MPNIGISREELFLPVSMNSIHKATDNNSNKIKRQLSWQVLHFSKVKLNHNGTAAVTCTPYRKESRVVKRHLKLNDTPED